MTSPTEPDTICAHCNGASCLNCNKRMELAIEIATAKLKQQIEELKEDSVNKANASEESYLELREDYGKLKQELAESIPKAKLLNILDEYDYPPEVKLDEIRKLLSAGKK